MSKRPEKRRNYETYMAKQFSDNAVRMPDELFDKWLLMVVRKRAELGSERAKDMLLSAENDGFPISEATREAIENVSNEDEWERRVAARKTRQTVAATGKYEESTVGQHADSGLEIDQDTYRVVEPLVRT